MATDYAGKEKEFVASLGADTGRDLDGWMEAITSANLAHRNDIIDWLRHSGFTFANASWLERIHHNGGRLIYAGDDHAEPRVEKTAAIKTAPPVVAPPVIAPPVIPNVTVAIPRVSAQTAVPRPSGPPSLSIVPASPAALDPSKLNAAVTELLLSAKGLRPLALVALQEIMAAAPNAVLAAEGPFIMVSAPKPFLALLPGAKALRFYGPFDRAASSRIARSEATIKTADKAAPPFPVVLVLSDARLIDDEFRALIAGARANAHG